MAKRTVFTPPAEQRVRIDSGEAFLHKLDGMTDSYVLHVNGVPSSCITLSDPLRLDFEYLDWMSRIIDVLCPAGTLRAVHLGAAGCALPRWVHATRPGSRQTAIDIDAALLRYVRDWFDLPRSPALALRPGDALAELHKFTPATIDLIVRDVFAGDTTPAHVTTSEFYTACAQALTPQGVLLCNVADVAGHGPLRAELAAAEAVFDQVWVVAEPGVIKGRRFGNVVLIAGPQHLDQHALARTLGTAASTARLLGGDDLHRFRSS